MSLVFCYLLSRRLASRETVILNDVSPREAAMSTLRGGEANRIEMHDRNVLVEEINESLST